MGWIRIVTVTAVLVLGASFLWPQEKFSDEMIKGKRVIITGASSGIGEQLAYTYAQLGASVFITARRVALLEKVIAKCKRIGSPKAKFGFLAADMADVKQTQYVIDAGVHELGGLDQIIINHAMMPNLEPWSESQRQFDMLDKVLDVNFRTFAQLAAQATPYLSESSGNIGVVSSVVGRIGMPLMAPYSATKFAMEGFFSAYRHEVKPFNVSVTVAVLGGIDTEGLTRLMEEGEKRYTMALSFDEYKNSLLGPALPSLCAFEIMRGTTMREDEIFFPSTQLVKYVVKSRDIFPYISNHMGKMIMDMTE